MHENWGSFPRLNILNPYLDRPILWLFSTIFGPQKHFCDQNCCYQLVFVLMHGFLMHDLSTSLVKIQMKNPDRFIINESEGPNINERNMPVEVSGQHENLLKVSAPPTKNPGSALDVSKLILINPHSLEIRHALFMQYEFVKVLSAQFDWLKT